jgi:nucleoid-associated protein YgaU
MPAPAPVVAAALTPSFDIVRVSPRGEAVLAGRSAPGAKVVVSDNGHPIAEATSDSEGQWVALPAASLPAGGQQLALSSVTATGVKAAGDAPLLVVVPPAAPPSPSPTKAADPAPATAVAILTPPNAVPRVLQGLPAAEPDHSGKAKLGLDVVDYDEHGAIRFGGAAPPGARVRAYIDNHAAGDAVADADGRWSLSPPGSVAVGDHRLRVDQLSHAGKVTSRVELPFERTSVAALDVREGHIVVQPHATLWRIARAAYGQGVRYTVIYQANRNQIRDPNLIFPGQIFDIPTAASP